MSGAEVACKERGIRGFKSYLQVGVSEYQVERKEGSQGLKLRAGRGFRGLNS